MRTFLLGLTLLLSGCFFPPSVRPIDPGPVREVRAREGALRVGVAVRDITPPADCELSGFSIFRDADGVNDPLYARALVLERGETRVAIIALDLLGLQAGELDRMRPELPGAPADAVLVMCTHTHAGPDTLGFWGFPPFVSGIDRDYFAQLEVSMQEALAEAVAALRPAEVAVTQALVEPKGIAKNLRFDGRIDRELTVLHAREPGGGATLATLAIFGSHPEALGSKNTKISADYAAPLVAELEGQLGGTGLFAAGALGAMVTPDVERGADGFAETERIGRALGRAATEAIQALPAEAYEREPALSLRTAPVAVVADNGRYRFARSVGLLQRELKKGHLMTEVNLLRIGDASFLTVPGEMTPDAAEDLESLLPGRVKAVLGLTDDELGYLLPADQWELDAFSYESTFSPGRDTVPALRVGVERLCAPHR
ncbi:MAG: neutral/alkaline non-lysosomal ceramidase N-terminal domain-containing protein [Planctomycetota bacterium]|jgi:hypothetical protein